MKGVVVFPFQVNVAAFDLSTIDPGQDMTPIKNMNLNFFGLNNHVILLLVSGWRLLTWHLFLSCDSKFIGLALFKVHGAANISACKKPHNVSECKAAIIKGTYFFLMTLFEVKTRANLLCESQTHSSWLEADFDLRSKLKNKSNNCIPWSTWGMFLELITSP